MIASICPLYWVFKTLPVLFFFFKQTDNLISLCLCILLLFKILWYRWTFLGQSWIIRTKISLLYSNYFHKFDSKVSHSKKKHFLSVVYIVSHIKKCLYIALLRPLLPQKSGNFGQMSYSNNALLFSPFTMITLICHIILMYHKY